MASGLRDPIVPGGAEPSRVEGGGVSTDVGVAGGLLIYAQCQSFLGAGCRVVVKSDFSSCDRARPGL